MLGLVISNYLKKEDGGYKADGKAIEDKKEAEENVEERGRSQQEMKRRGFFWKQERLKKKKLKLRPIH